MDLLHAAVALQKPPSQGCLGTQLHREVLHCSKLRKITAKCLKIPLGFGSDVMPVSVILLGLDLAA